MSTPANQNRVGRRVLFVGSAAAFSVAVIEVLAVAALSLQGGGVTLWGDLEPRQREVVAAHGAAFDGEPSPTFPAEPFRGKRVMHPYTGFVLRDAGPEMQLEALSGDQRTVVTLGGSLAAAQSRGGIEGLREELSKSPEFAGRELLFIDLAMPGVKQPQQLMILSYLIALGAKFDIVINLDGFNELMVSSDLADIGVYPHYSHAWPFKSHQLYSHSQLRRVSKMVSTRERRVWLAELTLGSALRYSATVAFFWSAYDRFLQQSLADSELWLANSVKDPKRLSGNEFDYQSRGPWDDRYESRSVVFSEVVDVWTASSIAMKQLADAKGFRYFHFLQPNQYIGSKPMSPEERATALKGERKFGERMRLGYPSLQNGGSELVAAGVHFHDLTGVFAQNSEVLYRDGCCHVNLLGRDIIGRAMGRYIVKTLE